MDDFRKRGVAYRQIDVQHDLAARKEMVALSGGLKVPTIVGEDGSVAIGFDGF